MDFGSDIRSTIQSHMSIHLSAYYEGMKDGVRRHAWMKDGVSYVGSGFYTLKEALQKIDDERAARLEQNLPSTISSLPNP